MALKIASGLLRVWIVLSIVWVVAVGGFVILSDITHPTHLTSTEVGLPAEPFDDVIVKARNIEAVQFGAGLALVPPALILVIGSALGWAVKGFRA